MSRQGDETGAVSKMEKEGQKDESSHEEKGVEDAREERPSEAAVSKMETQSLSMVNMMIVEETHDTSQSTTEETHETSQSTTEETQGDRPCEMKGMVVEDWARQSDQASHHRELGSSNEPVIVIEDRAMELVEDIEQVVVPDKLSDIEVMDDMLTNLEDSSVGRGEVKIGGSERADSGLVPSRGVQEIGIANDHVYVSSSLRMVTDSDPVGSAHQHSILSAVLDIEPSAVQDVMEPPDNELPLLQDIVTFEGTPPEVVVMSTAVCDLLMKKQLSEGDKEEMKEKEPTTIQNTTMADQAETMADQAETMADPGPASCEDLSRDVSTNVETDSSNNGRHSDSDAGRHGNNSSTDATTSNSCHDDSDACNKDDSSKAPPTNPCTARVVAADKIKTRQEILM